MGRILIIIGTILILAGLMLVFKIQIPWIGRLPGDIYVKRGNFSFYFPVTTGILASVILSVLFYIFKFKK